MKVVEAFEQSTTEPEEIFTGNQSSGIDDQEIVDIFRSNPNISPQEIDDIAKQNNISKEELEKKVYELLVSIVSGEKKPSPEVNLSEEKDSLVLKKGDKPDSDFDPEQLKKGIDVEKEHTNDPEIAKQIAKAHLSEDPKYYDKLAKIEKKSQGSVEEEKNIKEQKEMSKPNIKETILKTIKEFCESHKTTLEEVFDFEKEPGDVTEQELPPDEGGGVDQTSVRELMLYIENDGDLYRQRYLPMIKNLAIKKARGMYDPDKAIKLFMYLADEGAKKYNKEFGAGDWHETFPKSTRLVVAQELRDKFEQEVKDKAYDYDKMLPKKHKGTEITNEQDDQYTINEQILGELWGKKHQKVGQLLMEKMGLGKRKIIKEEQLSDEQIEKIYDGIFPLEEPEHEEISEERYVSPEDQWEMGKESIRGELILSFNEYSLLKKWWEGHGFPSSDPIMKIINKSIKKGNKYVFVIPNEGDEEKSWYTGKNFIEKAISELERAPERKEKVEIMQKLEDLLGGQQVSEETPSGRESQVRALKRELPKTYVDKNTGKRKESNPFAVAWASKNKEKGK